MVQAASNDPGRAAKHVEFKEGKIKIDRPENLISVK